MARKLQVFGNLSGGLTDEEFANKVVNIITEDVSYGGAINDAIYFTAEMAAYQPAILAMYEYDLLATEEEEDGLKRNVPTYAEFDAKIGSIENVLDSIIAIQTRLIGGDSV